MPQFSDLLCLFEQDGKQDGFKRQKRVALADGSNMSARGSKDAIEDVLVASPQAASKGREHGFGLVEVLRDGGDGSAHGSVRFLIGG